LHRMAATALHLQLLSRLASHLRDCDGFGIVLIDEPQKFIPGALEMFLSGTIMLYVHIYIYIYMYVCRGIY
jgi:hypothetical protein